MTSKPILGNLSMMSDEPLTAFGRLCAEVKRLHDVDARHKRGFLLSSRTPTDALLHTIEELTEVGRAQSPEDRVSEMGDALGCLIHYAIKAGLSLEDAAESALRKLPTDFPGDRP